MTLMKVAYIHSPELQRLGGVGTHPPGRSHVVHSLIQSYGMLNDAQGDGGLARANIVQPQMAAQADLLKYHSSEFVDALLGQTEQDESELESDSGASSSSSRPNKRRRVDSSNDRLANHGLIDDCAPFHELPAYALAIAGSSITAARHLLSSYDIVINWEGGRHHAQRAKASGFCYVQDIVLGMGVMRREGVPRPMPASLLEDDQAGKQVKRKKPRLLYLDLDIHFGDGVASAFVHPYKYSNPPTPRQLSQPQPSVLTLSLHHSSPGFFPPDPLATLTPVDTATPFSLSIPLLRGSSNKTYSRLFTSCVEPVMKAFDPDYVILLLGMDALNGDKLVEGAGNWSLDGEGGVKWCVEKVKSWIEGEGSGRKLMVLGGGGYDIPNTARGWAMATSVLLGRTLDVEADIPDHDNWQDFSPSFVLDVPAGRASDENSEAHLSNIEMTYETVTKRIAQIMT